MDLLEPNSILALPTDNGIEYKGLTADGNFFYLTIPKSYSIYKFDSEFKLITSKKTLKSYSCICYDNLDNCFWASIDKENGYIYKLDSNLNEIEQIKIGQYKNNFTTIVGLSYDLDNNTIFIAFSDFIAKTRKDGYILDIFEISKSGFYTSVVSVSPYFIAIWIYKNTQYLSIFSSNCELLKTYCFPKDFLLKDILFDKYTDYNNLHELSFYILAMNYRSLPELLYCKIENLPPIELSSYNYSSSPNPPDPPPEQLSHQDFPEPQKPTHCEDTYDVERNIIDIMESIVSAEVSISQILNIEGEKLQKAVELSDNICDLLEINKSINKTIINITYLEQILYSKLDSITSLAFNNTCTENYEKIKD